MMHAMLEEALVGLYGDGTTKDSSGEEQNQDAEARMNASNARNTRETEPDAPCETNSMNTILQHFGLDNNTTTNRRRRHHHHSDSDGDDEEVRDDGGDEYDDAENSSLKRARLASDSDSDRSEEERIHTRSCHRHDALSSPVVEASSLPSDGQVASPSVAVGRSSNWMRALRGGVLSAQPDAATSNSSTSRAFSVPSFRRPSSSQPSRMQISISTAVASSNASRSSSATPSFLPDHTASPSSSSSSSTTSASTSSAVDSSSCTLAVATDRNPFAISNSVDVRRWRTETSLAPHVVEEHYRRVGRVIGRVSRPKADERVYAVVSNESCCLCLCNASRIAPRQDATADGDHSRDRSASEGERALVQHEADGEAINRLLLGSADASALQLQSDEDRKDFARRAIGAAERKGVLQIVQWAATPSQQSQ